MSDKRDKFNADYRKHIKAAKDWIGQAEESIDKDNEIRSDLNLMLAQAELQRAKERDDVKLWKKWLRWTIPWVAAIAIAAGYVVVLKGENQQEVSQPVVVEQTNTTSVSVHSAGDVVQDSAESQVYHDGSQKTSNELSNDNEIAGLHDVEIVEENKEKDVLTVRDDEVKDKAMLPTEDMQRLMQSAGRTLRE